MTKTEQAWIDRVNKAMKNKPKRFGFYTTGDKVEIYDKSKGVDDENYEDGLDFCKTVRNLDAYLGRLNIQCHSTAG